MEEASPSRPPPPLAGEGRGASIETERSRERLARFAHLTRVQRPFLAAFTLVSIAACSDEDLGKPSAERAASDARDGSRRPPAAPPLQFPDDTTPIGGKACTTDADCSSIDPCHAAFCDGAVCIDALLLGGTPLPDAKQTAGDCATLVCDENAKVAQLDDPSDNDDGNECTTDACVNGLAAHSAVTEGTPCSQGHCYGGKCLASDDAVWKVEIPISGYGFDVHSVSVDSTGAAIITGTIVPGLGQGPFAYAHKVTADGGSAWHVEAGFKVNSTVCAAVRPDNSIVAQWGNTDKWWRYGAIKKWSALGVEQWGYGYGNDVDPKGLSLGPNGTIEAAFARQSPPDGAWWNGVDFVKGGGVITYDAAGAYQGYKSFANGGALTKELCGYPEHGPAGETFTATAGGMPGSLLLVVEKHAP